MTVLRAGFWVLGAVVMISVAGCPADEDLPTQWEIIEGTAALTASIAVDSATGIPLVTYGSRTGQLTIAADSSVTGWIKIPANDTMHFTGIVTSEAGDLLLEWTGSTPTIYRVLTDPNYPTTYALISLDVLHANLVGDPALESYLVYWEFHR